MKILNLYAGIGGNRKLWGDNHEITAVEFNSDIACVNATLFPNDKIVVEDAHDYLLRSFQDFDFIWSSPQRTTHTRNRLFLKSRVYPDMRLYQEVILLRQFFKGKFCVENVSPYYKPLIQPSVSIDRHLFWTNFRVSPFSLNRERNINYTTKYWLSEYLGITLPNNVVDARMLLRNAVHPEIGRHILQCAENCR